LTLRSSSPSARSELSLALVIVESPWVWQSSPGSDELDHLSSFCDIDGPCLILVVVLQEWYFDDFVQDAQGEAVEEESYSFFIADSIAGLSY
jgi:hypothetical protein